MTTRVPRSHPPAPGQVGLLVHVPAEMRQALKRKALDEGTTVSEIVRRLIEGELARTEG